MRLEKDSLGGVEVPKNALYGAQTVRAIHNFPMTGQVIDEAMIEALAEIKKASAQANYEVDDLSLEQKDMIVRVCDEILTGKYREEFPTDAIQGGAGTSINMNMNEVIANRASQLVGEPLGTYEFLHPNDHVNCGQSTNDVIPTAGKLASLKLLESLLAEQRLLEEAFLQKAEEFDDVIKVGRTHLQDAVLISFGQIFKSHASMIRRDRKAITSMRSYLLEVNMGGTAVGTGVNAKDGYQEAFIKHFKENTKQSFEIAADLVDSTRNLDVFGRLHSQIKIAALNLSRTANDYRLMASGPRTGLNEINLPKKQPGSSIMPGKVNPVILEVCNQAAFEIIGNDTSIDYAIEAGQMELNVFEPVLFKNLFESIRLLTNAYRTLRCNAIEGLSVNVDLCTEYSERSFASATPLIKVLGYDKTTELIQKSVSSNTSLKAVVLEEGLMSEEEYEQVVDPFKMIGGR